MLALGSHTILFSSIKNGYTQTQAESESERGRQSNTDPGPPDEQRKTSIDRMALTTISKYATRAHMHSPINRNSLHVTQNWHNSVCCMEKWKMHARERLQRHELHRFVCTYTRNVDEKWHKLAMLCIVCDLAHCLISIMCILFAILRRSIQCDMLRWKLSYRVRANHTVAVDMCQSLFCSERHAEVMWFIEFIVWGIDYNLPNTQLELNHFQIVL